MTITELLEPGWTQGASFHLNGLLSFSQMQLVGERRRKELNFKPFPRSHHSGVAPNNDESVDHLLLISHNNDVSCFDSSPFKRDGGRWQAITQHGRTAMGAGRIIHRNSDSSKSKRWGPTEEPWFYFYTSNQLFECIMNAVNTPHGYNENTL